MSMIRGCFAHFPGLSLGFVSLEGCESLLTHLKNRKLFTMKFSVRHSRANRQPLETQELDNVYWLLGLENLADGLTKTQSDMAPLLRLLESGT